MKNQTATLRLLSPPSPLDTDILEVLAIYRALPPYQKGITKRLMVWTKDTTLEKTQQLVKLTATATPDQVTALLAEFLTVEGY